MRNLIAVALMITALGVSSCAYVTGTPYKPGVPSKGISIPEQIPLLVVSGASTSVIYANNPNRGTRLSFGSFLAKHKFEAEFSNGSISKISSDQDTTEVAVKLIELVNEAVKVGNPIGKAFSGKSGDAGGTGNRFGIYQFNFDQAGNFIGLTPVLSSSGLIEVPVKRTPQIIRNPETTTPSKPKKPMVEFG